MGHVCLLVDIFLRVDSSLFRNSEGVVSPDRHVRTRLYFTSESHVHAMANVLKYGGLFEVMCRSHACVCACVYMCVCVCVQWNKCICTCIFCVLCFMYVLILCQFRLD